MKPTDTKADKPISEVYSKVADLCLARGIRSIKDRPGLTIVEIDKHWTVKINPHRGDIENIPFGHMYVEFNGWPAGLISPYEGTIAAGEAANEDTLIDAIDKALSQ